MLLLLLWTEVADNATVRGPFVRWYLTLTDEEASISTLQVPNTLEETPNFVRKAAFPHTSCGGILDKMPVFEHFPCFLVDDGTDKMLRR